MRHPPSAREAAAQEPLCDPCVSQQGLCASCRPSVVPQLKRPSWHRDVHLGDRYHAGDVVSLVPEPSPDVVKQRRKVDRREQRRKGPKCYARFERALAGAFTPTRPRRAA